MQRDLIDAPRVAADPPRETDIVTPSRIKVNLASGSFSFLSRNPMQHVRRMGIDSEVGELRSSFTIIEYDVGEYCNTLKVFAREDDYAEENRDIDGREGFLVSYRKGEEWIAGLYVANALSEPDQRRGVIGMTLIAKSRDEESRKHSIDLLRSIQLHRERE